MSTLYERIEKLCNDYGETITTLCKRSGVARSSLTALKKGRTETLSFATMQKIADHFGITVESLANDTEQPSEPQIDSFAFALYNETKGLSQEQKDLLMRLARDMNNRKD